MLEYAFANQIGFLQRPSRASDTPVSRQQVVTLAMPIISCLLLPQAPHGNQCDGDLVKTHRQQTSFFLIPGGKKQQRELLYEKTFCKFPIMKQTSRFH